MSTKWFVTQNEFVSGPFTSDEVNARLSQAQIRGEDLIWGRGMSSWQTVKWWKTQLPSLNDTVIAHVPVEAWHYALNGKSHGPYNRASLVEALKEVGDIQTVMLWTKGMKEWAPVYEFHDLLSEIGVNKRVFPRAELQGQCKIKVDGSSLVAPLLTISEGGMGVQLDSGLVSGQIVQCEVESAQLRSTLNVKAEVRYAAQGVVGLRFENLNAEGRGAIVAFVRQNQTRFVLKAA
jgi:hypothetical protein